MYRGDPVSRGKEAGRGESRKEEKDFLTDILETFPEHEAICLNGVIKF